MNKDKWKFIVQLVLSVLTAIAQNTHRADVCYLCCAKINRKHIAKTLIKQLRISFSNQL